MSDDTDGTTFTVLQAVNPNIINPNDEWLNEFIKTAEKSSDFNDRASSSSPSPTSWSFSSETRTSEPVGNSSSSPSTNAVPFPSKNGLKGFLENDIEGQAILKFYQKTGELTDSLRSLLCRRIIIHCLGPNSTTTLSTTRIENISTAIQSLFPTENVETYYLPAVNENGKKIGASGKLYYTYTYLRRKVKKQEKNLQSTSVIEQVPDENQLLDEIAEVEECFEWLKLYVGDDEKKVKDYWQKTFSKRKEILSKNTSIFEYVNTFPCLRTQIAIQLFRSDFAAEYPNVNFENGWNRVKPKLIDLLKKEIKSSTSDLICQLIHLNAIGGNTDALLFMLLPYLFKRGVPKRDVNGKIIRTSIAESREAFILHVENSCDLNQVISAHRENLRIKKLPLQPTPILVGKLDDITSAYVILDDEKFCFTTVRDAVDFAFVLFFTLGAKYPEEARLVWQLIQVVVYGIRVRTDIRSVPFSTLVGKLAA